MLNFKQIRILGLLTMCLGASAFTIDFLCNQQYLAFSEYLGPHFTCGFTGLASFVLGAGIAEWAQSKQNQLTEA